MLCTLCRVTGHYKNDPIFHPVSSNNIQDESKTVEGAHSLIALASSAPNLGKPIVVRVPAKPEHRKREDTGHHEKEDIRAIVEAIQSRSPAGLRMMEAFRSKFGEEILDARNDGGSRTKHWDFSVLVGPAPGVWKTVEHKGSQTFAPISVHQTPWSAGVQFHNGGCEK